MERIIYITNAREYKELSWLKSHPDIFVLNYTEYCIEEYRHWLNAFDWNRDSDLSREHLQATMLYHRKDIFDFDGFIGVRNQTFEEVEKAIRSSLKGACIVTDILHTATVEKLRQFAQERGYTLKEVKIEDLDSFGEVTDVEFNFSYRIEKDQFHRLVIESFATTLPARDCIESVAQVFNNNLVFGSFEKIDHYKKLEWNIDAVDRDGQTALHFLLLTLDSFDSKKAEAIVKRLLDEKPNLLIENNEHFSIVDLIPLSKKIGYKHV